MPYPKWVWSPYGGPYCFPKHWKRNTFLVACGWAVALYGTFTLSAGLERRLKPPRIFIPSQQWCTHAEEVARRPPQHPSARADLSPTARDLELTRVARAGRPSAREPQTMGVRGVSRTGWGCSH